MNKTQQHISNAESWSEGLVHARVSCFSFPNSQTCTLCLWDCFQKRVQNLHQKLNACMFLLGRQVKHLVNITFYWQKLLDCIRLNLIEHPVQHLLINILSTWNLFRMYTTPSFIFLSCCSAASFQNMPWISVPWNDQTTNDIVWQPTISCDHAFPFYNCFKSLTVWWNILVVDLSSVSQCQNQLLKTPNMSMDTGEEVWGYKLTIRIARHVRAHRYVCTSVLNLFGSRMCMHTFHPQERTSSSTNSITSFLPLFRCLNGYCNACKCMKWSSLTCHV